ncbi:MULTISPECIES: aromatic ring-hydroxylating dioxygenase subunit alpha [unclassified Beijerinckia]|uniref:aromatic ring-hydroxylating dioxygenase subunit alpha n=1 Tax=unclassified Beijerinckia TaxID=2638183 RepID=UPI00089BE1F3|nr:MULTISPECIES: aromatic ring-hydroxylating dioxygenase subunit alpha [unclassified Beijerinckia]MDH7799377.1 5,5'-dehydrodivanillate O-demethylase [Beijerinckia sp. GAS462]SED48186.1 5,5'-dehydrodivanillate O-demethylase [Beijerinckia sp. 28-YEA-48]
MLSEAKNKQISQVGPGTQMGDYLRRYWHPFAPAASLDKEPVKAIRLLGEDLTLYKDKSGTYGLVDRHCPHRHADLSYGYVEEQGIRCNYHGWLMSETGQVLEQPYDDTANPNNRMKERCKIKAYPVREVAGLLFAYMGPAPVPELPIWEPFTWNQGFIEIVTADIPCNWFQCQENSCDPVHFEWMHDNWSLRQRGETGPYAPKHLKVAFDEFDYGFTYRRQRVGQGEDHPMWQTGRVALWPNGFYLGSHFEWRVPVDDENTLSLSWFYTKLPLESLNRPLPEIHAWHGPIKQEDGRWISSHIINQDIIAWVGQGVLSDRTKENLGASDRGIAMIRNRFFEELDSVAAGNDAKGTIRDPEKAKSVPLPIAEPELFKHIVPRAEWASNGYLKRRLKSFLWHYGQPPEVMNAFRAAVGLDENGQPFKG